MPVFESYLYNHATIIIILVWNNDRCRKNNRHTWKNNDDQYLNITFNFAEHAEEGFSLVLVPGTMQMATRYLILVTLIFFSAVNLKIADTSSCVAPYSPRKSLTISIDIPKYVYTQPQCELCWFIRIHCHYVIILDTEFGFVESPGIITVTPDEEVSVLCWINCTVINWSGCGHSTKCHSRSLYHLVTMWLVKFALLLEDHLITFIVSNTM